MRRELQPSDTRIKWSCDRWKQCKNRISSSSRSARNTTERLFPVGMPSWTPICTNRRVKTSRSALRFRFAITPDHKTIAGFYTLSQYAVDLGDIPAELTKKLPKYPMVSATLLERLAVSSGFRGRGLGEKLMDALYRSLELSKQVASAAVVVDAKDASAEAFYKRYGFIELPRVARWMFIPVATGRSDVYLI
jgi:ribosomal protein S18 acetylase RimI-like enzyme